MNRAMEGKQKEILILQYKTSFVVCQKFILCPSMFLDIPQLRIYSMALMKEKLPYTFRLQLLFF